MRHAYTYIVAWTFTYGLAILLVSLYQKMLDSDGQSKEAIPVYDALFVLLPLVDCLRCVLPYLCFSLCPLSSFPFPSIPPPSVPTVFTACSVGYRNRRGSRRDRSTPPAHLSLPLLLCRSASAFCPLTLIRTSEKEGEGGAGFRCLFCFILSCSSSSSCSSFFL